MSTSPGLLASPWKALRSADKTHLLSATASLFEMMGCVSMGVMLYAAFVRDEVGANAGIAAALLFFVLRIAVIRIYDKATALPSLADINSPFADPSYQREVDEAISLGYRVFSPPLSLEVLDNPKLFSLHKQGLVVTGSTGLQAGTFTELLNTPERRRRQMKRVH